MPETKVLVVISSSDVGKALTGFMWTINALKNKWVDDVELVLFGPVERLVSEGNEALLNALLEYSRVKGKPLACRRIAENEGYVEQLKDKVRLIYVGSLIGDYLRKGYIPMVF